MDRQSLRREVGKRLSGRQLVFFGTRGDDAEGLGDVPELAAVFSIIAAPSGRSTLTRMALEDVSGRRVDLDTYDIDDHLQRPEVVTLRRQMLRTLSRPSVVVAYRPSTFLSSVCFARAALCTNAGLFAGHQAAFEHKPWVESALRSEGLPCIEWSYLADEDQVEVVRRLSDGPLVLRRSRSSGGTGLTLIDTAEELRALWPHEKEAFVSVARFIPEGLPTNVGGVVWDDGVTLHGASVQLIGVPELTTRPFGYCGNDFAAAKSLPASTVSQMESATLAVGNWLRSFGFRGAYGVDFLVDGETPLFMEVNPRLQGVSHLSCQLSAQRSESCVLLEHLAAHLGVPAPRSAPLARQVADAPEMAHMVLHSSELSRSPCERGELWSRLSAWPEVRRVDVLCPDGVAVEPMATLARVTVCSGVTGTGSALAEPWASRLVGLKAEAIGE